MSIPFSAARFQQLLATEAIGRFFLYRTSTETTMTIARREADEGAPHGTIVMAEEQTAGRGRRGRSFASPPGQNLYFTLILRPSIEVHRRLPLILPLAICIAARGEGVDARIKWPNDVWAGERKLCGILIDAEITTDGPLALPGIGINVNSDPTTIPGLADIATSLHRELGYPVIREAFLARICNEIERLCAEPANLVVSHYSAMSMVIGRQVTITSPGRESFTALAESIDGDGGLVVLRGDGQRETISAADVSLRPA